MVPLQAHISRSTIVTPINPKLANVSKIFFYQVSVDIVDIVQVHNDKSARADKSNI